jgi:hypothetical protein
MLGLFACLMLLIEAGIASAATDSKTFPGAMCRQYTNIGRLTVNADGSIHNGHLSAGVGVVCPVMRDNTQYEDEMDMRIFFEGNPGAEVTCSFNSNELHGSTIDLDSDTLLVPQSGLLEMHLTAQEQVKDGYSNLHCILPVGPGVRLLMYRTTEHYDGEGATDSKTYGGVFAQHTNDGRPVGYRAYEGSIFRETDTGGYARWIIPVVRDVVASTWNRARLRVFDADDASNFNCLLRAYQENGQANANASSLVSTQDFDLGQATIEMWPKDRGEVAQATYVIDCLVPDGKFENEFTGIFMYDFREHN